jgi:voltage-gated sodium channel
MTSADTPRVERLARLVDSRLSQIVIGTLIVINAIALAVETYPNLSPELIAALDALNVACYAVFLIELIVRLLSYLPRPQNFFKEGWNIFDFIVIGGALIPGLREQTMVLRLLRLGRVIRLFRFLPEARMLVRTLIKSGPGVLSLMAITTLVIFIYGFVGWWLFGESLPQEWGNAGAAMLTLFILLTLENFPVYMSDAAAVTPWAYPFFISYVLIAAFVVLNLVIGIVLSAMEESRAESAAESSKDTSAPPVAKRLNDARVLLDGIARDLQSDDRETQPTHEEQRD